MMNIKQNINIILDGTAYLNSRYEGVIIIDELIDNIAPKKHSSFRGLIIFL